MDNAITGVQPWKVKGTVLLYKLNHKKAEIYLHIALDTHDL